MASAKPMSRANRPRAPPAHLGRQEVLDGADESPAGCPVERDRLLAHPGLDGGGSQPSAPAKAREPKPHSEVSLRLNRVPCQVNWRKTKG